MPEVFIVYRYYFDDSELSIEEVFSTLENAQKYVKDYKHYEVEDGDFSFNVQSRVLDKTYVPHLHQCLACQKQTYNQNDDCCDNVELVWVEDAERYSMKEKE